MDDNERFVRPSRRQVVMVSPLCWRTRGAMLVWLGIVLIAFGSGWWSIVFGLVALFVVALTR